MSRGRPHRFVPTTGVPAFRVPESDDAPSALPLDCRHGRILFRMYGGNEREYYLVGDPVTGDLHRVPDPERIMWSRPLMAVVFCAAAGCKHVDCHGRHFRVVIVVKDIYGRGPTHYTLLAAMYSSEIGAWRAPAKLDNVVRFALYNRGTLIGDEIYFAEAEGATIVKYDWVNHFLSVVEHRPPGFSFSLMVMEDGSLGLAGVLQAKLCLCSRRVTAEGIAEWVQCRVIDLNKKLDPSSYTYVVGFAEGVGVIFFYTEFGFFMMELKSGRVRKFDKP